MIILILKGHPLGRPYNSLTSFIYLNRGISHMQAQCYLIIDKMFVEIIFIREHHHWCWQLLLVIFFLILNLLLCNYGSFISWIYYHCSSLSYVTVTYVIEAMAAANAWSLSIERKAKSRSVQGQRQITDHSLTVSQTVSHHGRLSLSLFAVMLLIYTGWRWWRFLWRYPSHFKPRYNERSCLY